MQNSVQVNGTRYESIDLGVLGNITYDKSEDEGSDVEKLTYLSCSDDSTNHRSIDSNAENSHIEDFVYENVNNENRFKNNNESVMFAESGVTVSEMFVMVSALCLRFNLNKETRFAILTLIKLLAGPKFADLQVHNYIISQKFSALCDKITYVFYCPNCYEPLSDPITKDKIIKKNEVCKKRKTNNVISLKSENRFLCIDIEYQLRALLQTNNILKDLMSNVKVKKSLQRINNNVISDIHDGTLYKNSLLINERDERELIISFNFNTDGAPLFKSSIRSFWPIQLTINELSPKLRFKTLILAAVCILRSEPKSDFMNVYVTYFSHQVTKLYYEGFTVTTKNGT